MADRAGSLVGLRVNGGPVTIKVTRSSFDPEIKFNRSVTTDAGQAARSIVTQYGGIIKGTGYVDPSDAGVTLMLNSVGAPANSFQALTAVKYLLDISESGGSRHGYNLGSATLIVTGLSGQSDEGGMQEIEFELHSNAGTSYSSTL